MAAETGPATADGPGTPDGPAPQAAGQAPLEALGWVLGELISDVEHVIASGNAGYIDRDMLDDYRERAAAIAAAAPAPAAAPDSRRALLDIIDTVDHLDEPGPEADHIRLLAEYGLGEAAHPDGDEQIPPALTPVEAVRLAVAEEWQPRLDHARAETATIMAAAANTARKLAALADALDAEGREEITIARKHQGQRHETGMQRGRVFELCASRIRRVAGIEQP